MQFKPLADTGILLPEICLGTMTFGEQNTQEQAFQQLDYALDQGLYFWDTAEMYPVPPKPETQGATERIIGHWIAARGGRDKLLASKLPDHHKVVAISGMVKPVSLPMKFQQPLTSHCHVCKRIILTCISYTGHNAQPISLASWVMAMLKRQKTVP